MGSHTRRRAAHLIIALAFALLGAAFATPAFAAPAVASPSGPDPGLYVPAATLVTADGTVLYAKNPDAPRRVASTIKLLNALVVMDSVNMDTVITVPRQASKIWDGGVGLRTGQQLTVKQLLSIMLIHSANDAAEALAVGIAGSESAYVAMMNAKAAQLGLTHTHAADPHGLGKRERVSAADLAVIARHVMADPVLRDIVHQTSVRVPRVRGRAAVYSTTDALLGSYHGLEGVKTGYTDPAGYCFVGAAKRGGVELIGVVLGAHYSSDRFTQMRKLLDWGFAHTSHTQLASAEQTMGVVAVSGGRCASVTVHARRALQLTRFDQAGPVVTQVALPATIKAPVTVGQRLGSVQAVCDGKVVASVPLVADAAVAAVRPEESLTASAASARAGVALLWQRIVGVWAGLGHALGI